MKAVTNTKTRVGQRLRNGKAHMQAAVTSFRKIHNVGLHACIARTRCGMQDDASDGCLRRFCNPCRTRLCRVVELMGTCDEGIINTSFV